MSDENQNTENVENTENNENTGNNENNTDNGNTENQNSGNQNTESRNAGNQNSENKDSLKSEWKVVGAGLGKTFTGLGKTLIKTAKVGVEKMDDWAEDREGVDHSAETESMKEGWKTFGADFVDSAKAVGKTTYRSVEEGVDIVDSTLKDTNKNSGDSAGGENNSSGDENGAV